MTIADIKSCLIKIAKKIEKVEDKDSDFCKNPKWQDLRSKQDSLYSELAKQEGVEDVYQINER
jgi:hypothetical protein